MKRFFFTSMALSFFLQAEAQHFQKSLHFPERLAHTRQLLFRMAQQSRPAAANKPTGIQQRVIAQADRSDSYTDSTFYTYSGTRGSTYNCNSIVYNDGFASFYAPMPLYATMTGGYNPLYLQADSIVSFEDGAFYDLSVGHYRPDNKLDSFEEYNGSDFNRTIHQFNPQGFLTALHTLSGVTGGAADTLSKQSFAYNAAFTQLLADTTWYKDPTSGWSDQVDRNQYFYSSQGKLDSVWAFTSFSGNPVLIASGYYTYDANGNIQTIRSAMSGTGGEGSLDSFGYTSGIPYATYWRSDYSYGGYTESNIVTWYPGSTGQPDSLLVVYADGGDTSITHARYTHNSFGNPETIRYSGTSDGDTEEGVIAFYYETYDDGTAISRIKQPAPFRVAPNPFKDHILLQWKGKEQAITLRLLTLTGQQAVEKRLRVTPGMNTIALPDLAPGAYFLWIGAADGSIGSTKLIHR